MKRFKCVVCAVVLGATSVLMLAPTASAQSDSYEEVVSNPELTPEHSVIVRFYAAVFARQPDVPGLVFWLEQFDSGEWDARRIADFFATSDEFAALYGPSTSNGEFVEALYPNVLGRQPDPGGFEFWKGLLDDGMSRAEVILLISNAPEFINKNWLPSDGTPFLCTLQVTVSDDIESTWVDSETIRQPLEMIISGDSNCPQGTEFLGTVNWFGGTGIYGPEDEVAVPLAREFGWGCLPDQVANIQYDGVPSFGGDPNLVSAETVAGLAEITCSLPLGERPEPPPGAPIAVDDVFTVDADSGNILDLRANDDHLDALLTISSPPTNGTLEMVGPNWVYTPDPDSIDDSFRYQLTNEFGTSNAKVTINVGQPELLVPPVDAEG